LGVAGDTMVGSSSNQSLLATHAVKKSNGDLDVLLINKDPSNAYTVSLSYSGFTPAAGTPTVYSYLANATSITSASSGTSTTQTVPAYSLLTVTLHPGSGGGGSDTTAPSTPTNLAASSVSATGATLSWTASTDNVGVTGYDVFRALGSGSFSQVGTATGTSFAATGLTASTGYRFYVRARDAANNTSGNSTTITVTTTASGGGSDTTAPSTPTNLAASSVSATGATLSWTASTDNVGVTGYDVFRALGSGSFSQVGTATGTSFAATGLTASTGYRFYVRARDAANNTSGNSTTITVTTTASGGGGGGTCRVGYTKSEWAGGLTASITVTNTGTVAINGWTLTFSFPGDTKVTSPWNATVTQSGAAVTATNVAYNGGIAAGANVGFGFQGTWTSNDAVPTSFSLNGSACTIG
jgi:chitodextrinase